MSIDWKRDATEVLIKAYRKHPVLYDMRHPRYYNKTVRGNSLQEIVEQVREQRPETTMKDVVRKIQTLRTQFGQELTKMRRHSLNGSDYRPTVWWYQGLSFLQTHIKPRTSGVGLGGDDSWKQDPDDNNSTFNVSIVRKSSTPPREQHGADYEHSEEEMEYETEVHYEINSFDMKDMKKLEVKPIMPMTPAASTHNKRETVRYVERDNCKVVARLPASTVETDDQQSTRTLSPAQLPAESLVREVVPDQNNTTSTTTLLELKPVNALASSCQDERHKSLGLFVGSQMACLKDDYIFYETQSEILNVMTRGILRQLALDKKNSAKAADQESSREKRQSVSPS